MPKHLEEPSSDSHTLDSLWANYDHLLAYLKSQMHHQPLIAIDAEDVLQETFTSAWQHHHKFSGGEIQLLAWLKSIAKRKLIDRIRALEAAKRGGGRARIGVGNGDSPSRMSIELPAQNRSPSSRAAAGEAAESVNQCLVRLPARDQVAIRMRYFEGESLESIGNKFDLSQQAVSMLLKRAILRLRKEMGGESQFF